MILQSGDAHIAAGSVDGTAVLIIDEGLLNKGSFTIGDVLCINSSIAAI